MNAHVCARKIFATTPTFSGARRRNLDTAQRKRGNLRISSKFAIVIVPTKQTIGVTNYTRYNTRFKGQEKVGLLTALHYRH